jgi:hypothetical protein
VIRPGDLVWLYGQPVTVRCVLMGAHPYTAVLTDGRRVPLADLTSTVDLAASTQGAGW